MTVDTKRVSNRRDVRYDTMRALQEDAEQLAAGDVNTLGNWTYGQILQHLARAINGTIDGFDYQAPWPMRVVGRLLFKKKFLAKTLPSGFQIPKKMRGTILPEDIPVDQALDELRAAISRLQSTDARATHPFMGKLTREESDQFQLRHAEMHMSFVVPA